MFTLRLLTNQRMMVSKAVAMNKLAVFRPMMLTSTVQRAYHENVIDHYEKPRNVGNFNTKDANVGTGLVGAPACGDVMRLQIKVNQESNRIEKAVFKVSKFLILYNNSNVRL
jgi:hypothetical protein